MHLQLRLLNLTQPYPVAPSTLTHSTHSSIDWWQSKLIGASVRIINVLYSSVQCAGLFLETDKHACGCVGVGVDTTNMANNKYNNN